MRALAALLTLPLALALALPASAQGTLPPPLVGDALTPPPVTSVGSSLAAGDLRGPSQYMAGDVAVRLVLPESTGPASTEDWTAEQIAEVQASIQAALDWWAAQLPLARLRFQVRLELVPTSYEPTRHGLAEEGLWVGETLGALGFTGDDYFAQAYDAAYALRDELDADWATTIFVANSAEGSGYFADGYFAYAYINGPFMVLTSDVGGYGAHRVPAVAAHELGHIFGALDQYYSARVSCERSSGYLNVPTTNSQYGGCGTRLPSIMLEPIAAFGLGAIDPSARGQVGYRDGDGDGVIDPLDTAPALDLADQELRADGGRPVLSGTSEDLAFPSPLQPAVTINTISAIEYRVAGSAWQPVAPADGTFDSASEAFSAELALYDGQHSVELRAINSAGVASQSVRYEVSVSGVGPQPAYAVSAPATSAGPELPVSLTAPAGTLAYQISPDPDFAGAEWQTFAPETTYLLPEPGEHTLYVRFRDSGGRSSLAYPVQTTLAGQMLYLPLLVR